MLGQSPLPVVQEARRPPLKLWVAWALMALPWLDLIGQLSHAWETRDQYAYGWFVPFFALFLLWKRWDDRPSPAAPSSQGAIGFLAIGLVLCVFPMRLVAEVNGDWPLISWAHTMLIVAITLYAIYLAGSWSWVSHFFFPVAFILVAVTWPHRIEKGITQNLMQIVAGLTVEVLSLIGIPVLQRGNLIEVGTGVVGVDEACSGIRSFQSTLMASLLMGELYRLRLKPRVALLFIGMSLAFGFNVLRTLILTWQASQNGVSAVDKWHDSAGMSILVACFLSLWGVAALMMGRWGIRPSTNDNRVSLPKPRSESDLPGNPGSLFSPLRNFKDFMIVAGVWTGLSLIATELWYRSHERVSPSAVHWTALAPKSKASFQEIPLTEFISKKIGHDIGLASKWEEDDGKLWSLYFFRWFPDSIQKVIMARQHRPDVCLPAAGSHQVSDEGIIYLDAGSLKLPFRRYVFEQEGRPFHVFFCQWEDGKETQSGLAKSEQLGRFQSVLNGRRKLGQQTMELILMGYESLDAAEAAVRARLTSLVEVRSSDARLDNPRP